MCFLWIFETIQNSFFIKHLCMAEYIWNYGVAMKQSEKCIENMMQNSFICRVGWAGGLVALNVLIVFEIRSFWKSRVVIGHTFI